MEDYEVIAMRIELSKGQRFRLCSGITGVSLLENHLFDRWF